MSTWVWLAALAGVVVALRLSYMMGRSVGWHGRGHYENALGTSPDRGSPKETAAELLELFERVYAARADGLIPETGDVMKDIEAVADLEVAKLQRA